MNENRKFYVIGVDFTSATPETRAAFHLTPSQIIQIYQQEQLPESLILSTCNRTEFYFLGLESVQTGLRFLETVFGKSINPEQFYIYQESEAWLHLLELAVGLKSMIVGETEILGQIQAALQLRRGFGRFGREQGRGFERIIAAARRIRQQTNIGGFSSSLYTLVMRELKRVSPRFDNLSALILGNGVIARKLAQTFRNHRLATTILSRGNGIKRHAQPQPVLDDVKMVFGYDHLHDLLAAHSVIVAATAAPHYILKPEHSGLLQGKILIDLAFPRNIDPVLGLSDSCRLWDLEHFALISRANLKSKTEAVAAAKMLCASALERIVKKQDHQLFRTDPAELTG